MNYLIKKPPSHWLKAIRPVIEPDTNKLMNWYRQVKWMKQDAFDTNDKIFCDETLHAHQHP